MNFIFILSIVLIVSSIQTNSQNYKLEGGYIWDGIKFDKKDIFIVDSIFKTQSPSEIDSVLDLSGKFIIPPFGDFHTHLFDGSYSVKYDSIFLSQGIFFAQDLVNDPEGRDEMSNHFKEANTIDVAYANGCLTSDYGHPIEGYERMALNISWPKNEVEKQKIRESRIYENRTYFIINTERDVKLKFTKLIETNPDVIKIILFNSEEYLDNDFEKIMNRGLQPNLLPSIVEMATDKNLRVIAHVESEYDLKVSIDAGIKYIAHLPHYSYRNDGSIDSIPPLLPLSTLRLMNKSSIKINPTLVRTFVNIMYIPEEYRPDSSVIGNIKDFHRLSLLNLKKHNIEILAGADITNKTSVDEILYYNKLNVFDAAELLNILINTSKEIFPDRKIGRIENGFEANCLVLNANPLDNIESIKTLNLKIKQGTILD